MHICSDNIHQKIHDLKEVQPIETGTLEDDWNLDLSPTVEDIEHGQADADEQGVSEPELEIDDKILSDDLEHTSSLSDKDPFDDFEEISPVCE